jgi:hypothetical protein
MVKTCSVEKRESNLLVHVQISLFSLSLYTRDNGRESVTVKGRHVIWNMY